MKKSVALSSHWKPVVTAACLLAVVFALLLAGPASADYTWTPTGGPGAGAGNGVVCCVPDGTGANLFVGDMTAGKVWRYDIAGGTWTDWPGLGGGWVRGLAFDPGHGTSGTLYAGTADGRVFANSDPMGSGTFGSLDNLGAGVMCLFYAGGPNVLFAGTQDGKVYERPDSTGVWSLTGSPGGGGYVHSLVVDTGHGASGTLYCSTFSGQVLKWDIAAGGSWTSLGTPVAGSAMSLAFDPDHGASGTLYVGSLTNGVVRNSDPFNGGSWSSMGGPGQIGQQGLFYDAADQVMYMNTLSGAVYKNIDSGSSSTWYPLGTAQAAGWAYTPVTVVGNRLFAGAPWDNGMGAVNGRLFEAGIPATQSIYPRTGAWGQTLDVTIDCTSSDIASAADAHFSGDGIVVNGTSIVNTTRVTANISIANGATAGARDCWVTYTDSGGHADRTNMLAGKFSVTANPSVTGRVTVGGTGRGGVAVVALQQNGSPAGYTFTLADGSYALGNLAHDTPYKIMFADPTLDYAVEGYNNAGTWADAADVLAPATGIDASLEPGLTVTGRVIDDETGEPVSNCDVKWVDSTNQVLSSPAVQTDIDGNYTLRGLKEGTSYKISYSCSGYFPAWYLQRSGWGTADLVPAGSSVSDEPLLFDHAAPTLTSISPPSALNNGTVHVTDLQGTGFYQYGGGTGPVTPSVVLKKSGQPDIAASDVVVASAEKVTCDFALRGKAAGTRDVVITNPDGQSATLAGGFTVNASNPIVSGVSPSSVQPGGTLTITGSGFGSGPSGSGMQGKGSSSYVTIGGARATTYLLWTDTMIKVVVPEGAASGSVQVFTAQGGSNDDKLVTLVYPTWYLAEGTTAWGFTTRITIENPNATDVTALLTFMDPWARTGKGILAKVEIRLPAMSQTTVDPGTWVPNQDFSTRVDCLQGKTIAVDRTMTWTGAGASVPEAHSSVGVTAPSKTWFLPEGSAAWGFETWTLVQNPGAQEAHVKLTYMVEGQGPKSLDRSVPAFSRATFSMDGDVGGADASIKVDSDQPVIAERSMYRNDRREGSCSVGATRPSGDFYLAEGSTAWGFTTYLLVQNPNAAPADVTVFYLTPTGPIQEKPFTMAANSRKTIKVNDFVKGSDCSIQVYSPSPVIAERSMYWDNGTGEACHDSIGLAQPHRTFYLPDGQTSAGWSAYTLVQNPNESEVDIKVTYLPASGKPVSFTDTLPPDTRRTYNMADKIKSARASVQVQVVGPSGTVMVERSMYLDNKSAGTDTIGGYSD